jgi:hypothetical protein
MNVLVCLGAAAFQLVGTHLIPQSLSMPIALVLFAILLYNGHRRFRILFGLLYLASSASFLFVAIARTPQGSGALWFYVPAALGLIYCSWVILLSQRGKGFLEVREQWLRSHKAS